MATSAAVSVFDDPRVKAAALRRLHELWAQGGDVPAGVRGVVGRAWSRPGTRAATRRPVVGADDVAHRRERVDPVLPLLHARLDALLADAGCELVVCDADGVVVEVTGPRVVRTASERLGFVEGACWAEDAVGANALGTALVEREPVQLFGAEHSDAGHHAWVCTGAPIAVPGGAPLGAFTLSGPLVAAHPHTLVLVEAVAAEAAREVDRGRAAAARAVAAAVGEVAGPHVVLGADGRVARAQGYAVPGGRVGVAGLVDGVVRHVDGVGVVACERRGAGWLLRPAPDAVTALAVDDDPGRGVRLLTASGATRVELTARQHQLVRLLADHPRGLGAREVAALAYGGAASAVTVRAELSRLRSRLGPVIGSRPYRLTVDATICNPSA